MKKILSFIKQLFGKRSRERVYVLDSSDPAVMNIKPRLVIEFPVDDAYRTLVMFDLPKGPDVYIDKVTFSI